MHSESHARDIHLWCQLILKYFPGYHSLQKDICDLVAQQQFVAHKLPHKTSYLVSIDKFVGFLGKTFLKQNFSLSCFLL